MNTGKAASARTPSPRAKVGLRWSVESAMAGAPRSAIPPTKRNPSQEIIAATPTNRATSINVKP